MKSAPVASHALPADRHVLLATVDGTFTPGGKRLAGPVDSVEKLAKLIEWAPGNGMLRPFRLPDNESWSSGQVRFLGSAGAALFGAAPADDAERADTLGQLSGPLAGLVDHGWELRRTAAGRLELAKGSGATRVAAEVMIDVNPWLMDGGDPDVGRCLTRWAETVGVLPEATAAQSGQAVLEQIMAARTGRKNSGAVVTAAGAPPDDVNVELRIQPEWTAPEYVLDRGFDHAEDLVWLEQECPELASAGMLTLGYGRPQRLTGKAAQSEAAAEDRKFGLWLVTFPPAGELGLPPQLPLPHPAMRVDEPAQAWITNEDLIGFSKTVRDGGAGLSVEQLKVAEALVWPEQTRVLDTWAKRLRGARKALALDPAVRALVEYAGRDYIASLTDADHAVWLAAIAAHIRFRGRRAAMRIAREYRLWPLYVRDAAMIYATGRDEVTGEHIELSDTDNTSLGRVMVTRSVELSDELILAAVTAENHAELAAILIAAVSAPGPTWIRTDTSGADPATGRAGSVTVSVESQDSTETSVVQGNSDSAEVQVKQAASAAAAIVREQGLQIPAAVLDVDGLWLPDGTRVDFPEPIVHAGQVAQLVYTHGLGYRLSPTFAEPGQIWITEAACRQFGIDVDSIDKYDRDKSLRAATEGIDFITLALADGWRFGGKTEESGAVRMGAWTRIYRADGDARGVFVALIPGMDPDRKVMPILQGASAVQIARRLQLLANALGYPWKINAGVTAIDLMVQTRTRSWTRAQWMNEVLAPSTTSEPYGIGDVERDFDWSRPPTSDEACCRYVHAYDRGGSYVAAIAGLELPIGDSVHHPEGTRFDPKMPGYWRVAVPEQQDWRLPYLLNPAGLKFTESKWMTTPTVQRALELGYDLDILEAITWPRHGRVLRGWYERFLKASTDLDTYDPDTRAPRDLDADAARNQSKVVRTRGVGLIGSEQFLKGKTGYSPERRLHIIAKAKANIAYRIDQIGQATGNWPVAAITDAIVYISNDPDPRSAWPGPKETFGRGYGQYKPAGSSLLTEHTQFLTGGGYTGMSALTKPDEWAAQMSAGDR
ncbi:hypothetical protein [Mycobacteroides abscessus]|uniref:hypothetical protein n=1 Tax=Mycobacteroides abscessus TaxID=36809 RepID=UPI0009A7FF2A|nr:hypothetical protein [Mycobacteroides abscessus]SKT95054.1 Uncharacterised protein [Mycobacteroides abscessus subsp. massiliense]SKU12955.1 Uncharacterised protein [Mycobacteroides abscessus subsp. massiliense]